MAEKKPYVVRVQEIHSKSVVVWAEDKQQARDLADGCYDSGDIDLGRNCYAGRDIDVRGIAPEDRIDAYDQYGDTP